MDTFVIICEFLVSKFICSLTYFSVSPKSTLEVLYQLFMDVHRAEKNVSHPTHRSSAEFKQGDALLSSSSFHIINKCPFCSYLVAHSGALLLIALL